MSESMIVDMLLSGHNDLDWFDRKSGELKDLYNDKFIAFHNQKVIDADYNLTILIKRLKQNNVNISDVFIKFISKIKAIL